MKRKMQTEIPVLNWPHDGWQFHGSDGTMIQIVSREADSRWHWWKDALPLFSEDYRKSIWRDGMERAAFAYELARRASANLISLPPFPELTGAERNFLQSFFGVADTRWAASSNRKPGYSDEFKNHLNLAETDQALTKFVLGWIGDQRKKHGVARPRSRPTKSRPVPWSWCEILDVLSGLDDSERSIKTKALRLGKEYSRRLLSATRSEPNPKSKRFRV